MEWNPLRSFVNQTLRSTLEKYVSNVDFDSLGVAGGPIVLRDLELRQESFPAEKGFHLSRGFVKELRVLIPWTQLLSASVLVEIRTVEVVFSQDEEYMEQEREKSHDPVPVSAAGVASGWLSAMLRTIVANATFQLSNVVLKYERKGGDLVTTLSLKSVLFCTCDANTWINMFQKPDEYNGELFKSLEIGGLTLNVERRAEFEMPLLKRTDAKVRVCLHLTPPSEDREPSNEESHSLSTLLQRVTSAVSVSAKEEDVTEVGGGMPSPLSSNRDPFHDPTFANPFNHSWAHFSVALDVWIERLDFSISEQQVRVLQEFMQPPIVTPRSEAFPVVLFPPPPPPSAPPVLTTTTSPAVPSGWTDWAWQTVAPLETSTAVAPVLSSPSLDPPKLFVVGLRVDRTSFSLMLHTTTTTTTTSSHFATNSLASPTAKKSHLVPVQTPTGVVFVEDDDGNGASQSSACGRRRLVCFSEIIARSFVMQVTRVAQTIHCHMDVASVEGTRWHEVYLHSPHVVREEEERRDVFFTWFGYKHDATTTTKRFQESHPHFQWNLWAHPVNKALPAIRVFASLEEDSKKQVLDVALAPLSATVDVLFMEGVKRFHSFSSPSRLPVKQRRKNSSSALFSGLGTFGGCQITIQSGSESVFTDLTALQVSMTGSMQEFRMDHFSVVVKSASAAKCVCDLTTLEATIKHQQEDMTYSFMLSHFTFGMSPSQAHTLLALFHVFSPHPPLIPSPTVLLENSVSDHVVFECTLSNRLKGSFSPYSFFALDVPSVSLVCIAGHTQRIFSSNQMCHVLYKASEKLQFRLGVWEADWEGLIKCAEFGRRFRVVTATEKATTSTSSSVSPSWPRFLPPFVSFDCASSKLMLTQNDEEQSFVTFPLVRVRNVEKDGELQWHMEGFSLVIKDHVVWSKTSAMGTLSHDGVAVSCTLHPVQVSFGPSHVDFLHDLETVVDRLLVPASLDFSPKEGVAPSSSSSRQFQRAHLVMESFQMTMQLPEMDNSRRDPVSDVPSMVFVLMEGLKADQRGQDIEVVLGNLIVKEEAFTCLSFRPQSTSLPSCSASWISNVFSLQLASFDCVLRAGAFRAPLALFAPMLERSNTRQQLRRKSHKSSQLELVPNAVNISIAPCAFTIPLTSTLLPPDDGRFEKTVFFRFPRGVVWTQGRSKESLLHVGFKRGVEEVLICVISPTMAWKCNENKEEVLEVEHGPLHVNLLSQNDVADVYHANLVVQSLSRLEMGKVNHRQPHGHQSVQSRNSASSFPIHFTLSELIVRIHEDVFVLELHQLFATSTLKTLSFDSFRISSDQQHPLVCWDQFQLEHQICEVSRKGQLSIVCNPLVLIKWKTLFLDPLLRLDQTLLPISRKLTRGVVVDHHTLPFPVTKVLFPSIHVMVCDSVSTLGLEIQEGLASLNAHLEFDCSLMGIQVYVHHHDEAALGKKKEIMLDPTDIRFFGSKSQLMVEMGSLHAFLGIPSLVRTRNVLTSFDALVKSMEPWLTKKTREVDSPPPPPSLNVQENAEDVRLLTSTFSFLLDGKEFDPTPQQVVFSDQFEAEWSLGFRFRFPQERSVPRLTFPTWLELEPGLAIFGHKQVLCQIFGFDARREEWFLLTDFSIRLTLPSSMMSDEFSQAFADWMEKDLEETNTPLPSHQTIHCNSEHEQSQADLFWFRWKLDQDVTETTKVPPSSVSMQEGVAMSNLMASKVVFHTLVVSQPILDVKLFVSQAVLHVMHACSPFVCADILLLSCSSAKCQLIQRQNTREMDWFLDAMVGVEVNCVKEFARSKLLKDTRIKAQKRFSQVDVEWNKMEWEIGSESLLLVSHIFASMVADISRFESNPLLMPDDDLDCDDAENTVCACMRIVFVNFTGHLPLLVKRKIGHEAPLSVVDQVAYSWSRCLCAATEENLCISDHSVSFSLDNGQTWTEWVNLQHHGTLRMTNGLFVSISVGTESVVQTRVAVHANTCFVNSTSLDIQVLGENDQVVLSLPSHSTRYIHMEETNSSSWSLASVHKPVPFGLVQLIGLTAKYFALLATNTVKEDNGQELWQTVEILPTFVLENSTRNSLRVQVRPEHRWESLQYALQSVSLSTSPPGPPGQWLVLPTVQSPHPPPSPPLPAAAVFSSTQFQIQEGPPMETPVKRKQLGEGLAQELLRSVTTPPSEQHLSKSFASVLELSSLEAENSLMEMKLIPGQKIGLNVDPRESHALLLSLSTALQYEDVVPLRLHANMHAAGAEGFWRRSHVLNSSDQDSCLVEARRNHIVFRPRFVLTNLLCVGWGIQFQLLGCCHPSQQQVQRIEYGESVHVCVPVHCENDGAIKYSCSRFLSDQEDIGWSDALSLLSTSSLLKLPIFGNIVHCWVRVECDPNEGRISLHATLTVINETDQEVSLLVMGKERETKHCVSIVKVHERAPLPSDVPIWLRFETGWESHALCVEPQQEKCTLSFVMGHRLFELRCETEGTFVLREERQPRFRVKNLSSEFAVEIFGVTSSSLTTNNKRIKFSLLPGPESTFPLNWACFQGFEVVELLAGSNLLVQRPSPIVFDSSHQERFLKEEQDEKLRLRMVLASSVSSRVGLYSDTEKGWSSLVTTTSNTMYTFLHGQVLIHPPAVDGSKLLTVSSSETQLLDGKDPSSSTTTTTTQVPILQCRIRFSSLLVKFSSLLVCGVEDVYAKLQSFPGREIKAKVGFKRLQLESLLSRTEYPIVFATEDDTWISLHRREYSLLSFRLDAAPLIVNMEDETLKAWMQVLFPLVVLMQADWKRARPQVPSGFPAAPPPLLFVCQSFEISPIRCLLTVKTSFAVFVGIDRTPIHLWSVKAFNVRCSMAHMKKELMANYAADVLLGSPALLGSLEILGNPTGWLRSLAYGVHDFVAIPLHELNHGGWGPRNLLRGVVFGWLGFLSHVVDGTLNSVSGFSASVARNLHLSIRRRDMLDSSSTSRRVRALLRSFAGVFIRPAEGAAEMVSKTTRNLSTRLRPPVSRLLEEDVLVSPHPVGPPPGILDLDRMFAWKLPFPSTTSVLATYVVQLDVDIEDDRIQQDLRIVVSGQGLWALTGTGCLLHDTFAFCHAWEHVLSVQESLVKLELAVLVVRTPGDHPDKLLRFTFQSNSERRRFVRSVLLLTAH